MLILITDTDTAALTDTDADIDTDTDTAALTDTDVAATDIESIAPAPVLSQEDQIRLDEAQREATDAQSTLDSLADQGFTTPEQNYQVESAQNKLAAAQTTINELAPAPVPLDQVTSDTLSTQLPINPATGLKPAGKRRGGRKPIERTEAQKKAAQAQRKERQKVGRNAIRTAENAEKVITTEFDPNSYESVDLG